MQKPTWSAVADVDQMCTASSEVIAIGLKSPKWYSLRPTWTSTEGGVREQNTPMYTEKYLKARPPLHTLQKFTNVLNALRCNGTARIEQPAL